jgi:GTPase SAR1 family protein
VSDVQSQKTLSFLSDSPAHRVFTRSETELKDLLVRDSAVRIGVVGPPGTGKTSLMNTACHGFLSPDQDELLGFMVPVPATADPNDIARQLALGLCIALLGERAGPRSRWVSDSLARKAPLIGSAAIVAGSVLLGLSAKGVHINTQMGLASLLLLAGIIGLFSQFATRADRFGSRALFRRNFGVFAAGYSVPRSRKLHKRAAALADLLEAERRFETTVTSGWTTGLTPLTGLQLGSSGSVSKKLLPTPLSDLAELFGQLAADVAAETTVLIGIDGLDKCDPSVDIDNTLFELRWFLTVPGCRYLIALAENSEPRASFRSSLIDTTVRCELLTAEDAQSLIGMRKQGVGLSDAFAALCFATSGGLPRDMVRITRFIVNQSSAQSNVSIASICNTIVQIELQVLSEELRWAARALPSWAQQQQLFNWAERLSDGSPKAHAILAIANDIHALAINESKEAGHDNPSLQRITHRAASLSYFCTTLLDFFTDNLDAEALGRALASDAASASLGRLAEARRLIDLAACGPAWADISAFRAEWGTLFTPAPDVPVSLSHSPRQR